MYGTDFDDLSPNDPSRSAHNGSRMAYLGGGALAAATLASGWFLLALFGGGMRDTVELAPAPVASLEPDAADEIDEELTAALFDPGYAGFRARAFAGSAPLPARLSPPVRAALSPERRAGEWSANVGGAGGRLAASVPFPARRPSGSVGTSAAGGQTGNRSMASAHADEQSMLDRIFGTFKETGQTLKETGLKLAYASPDGGLGPVRSTLTPNVSGQIEPSTAVYDISRKTVYMPDGTTIEAHSGLGSKMDDVRYAHVKMHGPTPPAVYALRLRERPFHGVRAIRLIPADGVNPHGRTGLLAHTYMLGPKGDSNGCVSFRNYDAFLQAFLDGKVERLVVVASRT